VKPTKRTDAAIVLLCKTDVEVQRLVPAAKKAALEPLCVKAVEGSTASIRGHAAERICLGLLGLSVNTPEATKKPLLQDCKSNRWD
jgi:hypothetical protein